MSSINIASRAMSANLATLQTVGHNIANANTAGYSRQTVSMGTVEGNFTGGLYYGNGVELTAVSRSFDSYLNRQADGTSARAAGAEANYTKMQTIENLFPLGADSLGDAMNKTLNAWVDVASSPTDSTSRQVVLDHAENLAGRFRDTSARLDELGQNTRLELGEVTDQINQISSQIATLNNKISATQTSASVPNDLLDQRDQLIRTLNTYVKVNTVEASDHSLSVFAAGSMPLVLGGKSAQLAVKPSNIDGARHLDLLFVQDGVSTPIDTNYLGGGKLDGLIKFHNHDLPNAQNQLGRLAIALTTQVNAQHRSGLDLNGNPGKDLLTPATVNNIYPSSVPSPTATLSVGIQDATQFRPSDYEVSYDSPTTVTVRRISDGTVVVPPGTNMASPATVAFDGLTLNLASGVPATGNTYLLRPFADGARNMGVSITSPANLAVASPVLVVPAAGNAGGLAVQQLARPAGATPPTGWTQSVLAFNAAGQYTVTTYTPAASTSAAVNYVPGDSIVVDGFSITLKGIPANGDSFTVRPPLSPETMAQNAGNAKAILALRDVDSFQGVTLADGYVSVFSNVATNVQSAKFAATFSTSQAASAETMRSGYAGVNLDEEAAKLVQYQQAYQASAKYLQTAQGLFDTLLSSFR